MLICLDMNTGEWEAGNGLEVDHSQAAAGHVLPDVPQLALQCITAEMPARSAPPFHGDVDAFLARMAD